MKFSEFWLREFVNPAINSSALAEQMTIAGLEINDIKPVSGKFEGVLIGEIVECIPHPDLDQIRLTKVNIGTDNLISIVCKAPNCRNGLKVAVATHRSILPNINKKLSEGKGMLCSYSDLDIFSSENIGIGIIEFPNDAPIGIDIRKYLQLDDYIFELNLTPNRADCLSVLGIARDIAAINNLDLDEINIEPVKYTNTINCPHIHVKVPIACPRFLGRVIQLINITVQTPKWMREKLYRSGIGVSTLNHNPIIDIANYVLLELGQPLQVYDLDHLNGEINIRMAYHNEKIVLIDNTELILNSDILVVADDKRALGLAGILGSKNSSLNKTTTNILLVCAFFNPLFISASVRKYGIHTESSYRFERGVDPKIQFKALERATKLIIDICGGYAGPIIDISNEINLPKSTEITLNRQKIERLIGYHIPYSNITEILQRLGCQLFIKQDSWQVIVPSWRYDLKIEEDLIEEITRIYGFNNIPNIPLHTDLIITPHCETELPLKRVKTLLIDHGYNEAITYSFIDPAFQMLLYPDQEAIILPNPISANMSAMRLSLLPGLLMTVIYNQNRQQYRIRLFESGLRFILDETAEYGIRQELMLAGVVTGNRYEEHWLQKNREVDFFDIKGDIEAILNLTGKLDNIDFKAKSLPPTLHPGQSASIYLDNNLIGYLGVIHPKLETKLDLNSRTFVFELEWNAIAERRIPKANDISRFPTNRRDIAIVVPKEVATADVLAECKKMGINHIVDINLFDVYCGKGIAKGYKSLAISLILQDKNRTLQEEDIAIAVDQCITKLKKIFKVSLRY